MTSLRNATQIAEAAWMAIYAARVDGFGAKEAYSVASALRSMCNESAISPETMRHELEQLVKVGTVRRDHLDLVLTYL